MPERGPHPRQRTAPYLEALQSFAARGPRRAMVPGHKGGVAADDGLRDALGEGALALDLPTLIEGVDIASDGAVAPYEAARRLAAEAWGARRTWFLTNGASQGNLAACLAIAQRGDARRRAAHRPRQHDRRPRPRGAAPDVRRSRGRRRARPRALRAALRARRGARPHARRGGGDRRLADLLRRGGRRRRPRPRCARPRRAARGRRGVGRAPGLLRRASAARAGRRRGPRHLEHAQARRQPDPVGDAPPRGRRAPRRGRRRPRAAARHLDEPEQPAARLAGRGAPPRGGRRAATCCARRSPSSPCCARRSAHPRPRRPRRARGRRVRRRGHRSAARVRRRARDGARAATRSRGGCAATATSTWSCAASTSSSPCSGSASGVAEHGRGPGRGARARVRARAIPAARARTRGARAGAPRAAVGRGRAVAAGGVPGGARAGADRGRRRAGSRRSAWPPIRPGSPTCCRASA